MGRGDKRSRKGKIFAGSYGKTRPKHKKKAMAAGAGAGAGAATTAAAEPAPKKTVRTVRKKKAE